MSKRVKSNNTSNSNINNNNNNNISKGYSNNSSFINSKIEINSKEKENTFKDFTQMDKYNFIKNCIKKVEKRDQEEEIKINDLKLYEKTWLSKINKIKEDIAELSRNIDEIKIAREDVEQKLKNKKVFLEIKMGKAIDENNNKKTMEEIKQINEGLQNDINNMNDEINNMEKEIVAMSEQSLETHQDIDDLKKKSEDYIRSNMALEKRIIRKEKELKKYDLDIKKLENKIRYQEINSENFLRDIEKWANKESYLKMDNIDNREQDDKNDD